jgi:hypothetical protein
VIPDSDLGAHLYGEQAPDPLMTTRQMELELPRTVNVKYMLAATEYTTASKQARRLIGASGQESTLELPLVLSDTKAQQVADVNLDVAWLQRLTYQFSLPRKYAYLEPTDPIVVKGRVMRLAKTGASARGVLQCDAVADDADHYAPNVVMDETAAVVKTVFIPGSTRLELM